MNKYPTLEQLRKWRKTEWVEEFCKTSGDDFTGGNSFSRWMVKQMGLKSWHTLAFSICIFATYGAIKEDPLALLLWIGYVVWWIGSYVTWRKKKKGSNPNRKLKGMTLSEFMVRCNQFSGFEKDYVLGALKRYRPELFERMPFKDLTHLSDDFWLWLKRNW